MIGRMAISYAWRGEFTRAEANVLHAECFGHPVLGGHFDACGFTPTNAGLIEL